MNYTMDLPIHNTKKNVLMEMYGSYKFILWAMGGVLLSVPIWENVPTLMGWVGLAVAVIGAVAQVVKIVIDWQKAKREQELHDEAIKLIKKGELGERELGVLKELLGG